MGAGEAVEEGRAGVEALGQAVAVLVADSGVVLSSLGEPGNGRVFRGTAGDSGVEMGGREVLIV